MTIVLSNNIIIERDFIKVCSNKTGEIKTFGNEEKEFLKERLDEYQIVLNNDKEIISQIQEESFKPSNNLITCLQIKEIK